MQQEMFGPEAIKDFMAMQKSLPQPKKDAQGHKHKYADLHGVLEIVQQHLHKHNFAIMQSLGNSESELVLKTTLIHAKGDSLTSQLKFGKLENPQAVGSLITYYRRYSIMTMLGLVGEDDNGESAKQSAKNAPKPNTISEAQLKRLLAIAKKNGFNEQQQEAIIKDQYGFSSRKLITKDKYDEIVEKFENSNSIK